MNKTCENCIYFFKPNDECRISPPAPDLPNPRYEERFWGVFPNVQIDWWCGQWKGDPWRDEGDPHYIGECHATLP